MDCKIYLGSVCVMLEDLGFQGRPAYNDFTAMSYYYEKFYYNKIFADITKDWILKICLIPSEMHIEGWERNNGLFIIKDEICIDLHHPESIGIASQFVHNIIKIAHRIN